MNTRMRLSACRAVAALLLLAVGLLLLLRSLRIHGEILDPFWPLLFATAGVAFLVFFLSNRADAWTSIPGFGLLGLAGSGGLQSLAPSLGATSGGSLFFGGIGLRFLALHVARRDYWWAIIPAGGLLTLAIVSSLSHAFRGTDTGGVLFLGLALTFVVVYLLPAPKRGSEGRHSRTWALITAVPFFALAVIVFAARGSVFNYVWPALLILAGSWLALRPARECPVAPIPSTAPEAGQGDIKGSDERPRS